MKTSTRMNLIAINNLTTNAVALEQYLPHEAVDSQAADHLVGELLPLVDFAHCHNVVRDVLDDAIHVDLCNQHDVRHCTPCFG